MKGKTMIKLQLNIYINPDVKEKEIDLKQIIGRISQLNKINEGHVYDSSGYSQGIWELKVVK